MRAVKAILAGVLAGILGFMSCQGSSIKDGTGGGNTMNQARDEVVQALALDDAAYFAIGDPELLSLQSRIAALFTPEQLEEMPVVEDEEPETVLAIGAPKVIGLKQPAGIPLLGACRYTGQRGWEVKYNQNFWIVATDLNDGTVRFGRPLLKDKRQRTPEPSGSGTPPNAMSVASVTTSVRLFDPRKILGLEWRPMKLAFTAIVYDWVSNTVEVAIKGESPESESPPLMRPSASIEKTDAGDTSLADAGGISVTMLETGSAQAPIPVRVVMNVPVQEIVVAPSAGEDSGMVAPMSFVLLQLDATEPLQADLVVPVTVSGSEGNARATAAFEFDLRAVLPVDDMSGTYQVYVIAGTDIKRLHTFTMNSE